MQVNAREDPADTISAESSSRSSANIDLRNHTLRPLHLYVSGKLNTELFERNWSRIIVRAFEKSVLQHPPRLILKEKRHKKFNSRRPTAQILSTGVLEVSCFPGRDYVHHYAMLISMHLQFMGKNSDVVECIKPSPETCMDVLMKSNLRSIGEIDIVVVGYVEFLHQLIGADWETGADDDEDKLFAWQRQIRPEDGCQIVYLGCHFSFWGDISGYLVHALRSLSNVKCIIYLGKAGSLRPNDEPNEVLATGNTSFLDDEKFTWVNVFDQTLQELKIPQVAYGAHVTVSSPLDETKGWFARWKDNCSWVDCEVGHMVKACQESTAEKIAFGYLHLVSDNVAVEHVENLTNEHMNSTIAKRKRLLLAMQDVLACYLRQYPRRTPD